MTTLNVTVTGIPRNVVAIDGMRKLHHPNAALNHSPGEQTAFGIFRIPVHFERRLTLLRSIKRIWNGKLHPKGHFHRLDTGFKHVVFLFLLKMHSIQATQQIRLASLLAPCQMRIFKVIQDSL